MKINALTPMIRTPDVDGTVKFYTGILGFKCDSQSKDSGWASVSHGSVKLMVAAPNDHEPFDTPTFSGSLYFYPDDVDDAWNELKDKARICYPIESFEYGMREFGIYDNNGYLLQFGQPVVKSGG